MQDTLCSRGSNGAIIKTFDEKAFLSIVASICLIFWSKHKIIHSTSRSYIYYIIFYTRWYEAVIYHKNVFKFKSTKHASKNRRYS
jgi:hypothetical protein